MSKIMMELKKDNTFTYVPLRRGEPQMNRMKKRFLGEGFESVVFYHADHGGNGTGIKLNPYFKEGRRKTIKSTEVGLNV